jgi:hypothetical protein
LCLREASHIVGIRCCPHGHWPEGRCLLCMDIRRVSQQSAGLACFVTGWTRLKFFFLLKPPPIHPSLIPQKFTCGMSRFRGRTPDRSLLFPQFRPNTTYFHRDVCRLETACARLRSLTPKRGEQYEGDEMDVGWSLPAGTGCERICVELRNQENVRLHRWKNRNLSPVESHSAF